MTHYETLGVTKRASDETIKRAYRRLAKEHHPDKHGGDGTRFDEIARAYKAVATEEARLDYERELNGALAADDASWGNPGGTSAAASTPPPFDLAAEKRRIQAQYAGVVGGIKQRFAALRQQEQDDLVLLLAEAAKLVAPPPPPADQTAAKAEALDDYQRSLGRADRLYSEGDIGFSELESLKSEAQAAYLVALVDIGKAEEAERQRLSGQDAESQALRDKESRRIRRESAARLAQIDQDEQQELQQAEADRDAAIAAAKAKK